MKYYFTKIIYTSTKLLFWLTAELLSPSKCCDPMTVHGLHKLKSFSGSKLVLIIYTYNYIPSNLVNKLVVRTVGFSSDKLKLNRDVIIVTFIILEVCNLSRKMQLFDLLGKWCFYLKLNIYICDEIKGLFKSLKGYETYINESSDLSIAITILLLSNHSSW